MLQLYQSDLYYELIVTHYLDVIIFNVYFFNFGLELHNISTEIKGTQLKILTSDQKRRRELSSKRLFSVYDVFAVLKEVIPPLEIYCFTLLYSFPVM